MAIRDEEQGTWCLLGGVGTGRGIGLVAYKEAPPLELNDITFLQIPESRVTKHFLGGLKWRSTKVTKQVGGLKVTIQQNNATQ